LPTYLTENERDKPIFMQSGKFLIAKLEPDREDITIHSIERFGEEISKAGTILLSGPLGKFEDEGRRQGTKRVFEAVAESSAIKIAGGGDTSEAIVLFGLEDKFDWISVGGGASLEFLANQTLPGIEALGFDL
jgi:3-phosphoglycerate kinase